ncbi:MAG: hypothetical protein ABIK28_11790, partial [Planctomycetota bacterium]
TFIQSCHGRLPSFAAERALKKPRALQTHYRRSIRCLIGTRLVLSGSVKAVKISDIRFVMNWINERFQSNI